MILINDDDLTVEDVKKAGICAIIMEGVVAFCHSDRAAVHTEIVNSEVAGNGRVGNGLLKNLQRGILGHEIVVYCGWI